MPPEPQQGSYTLRTDPHAREFLLISREHQLDHEVDHVPRREVLAGVLVKRLVELPDQLLEDRPHGRVVDRVGMEVQRPEPLHDLVQQLRLVELADRVVEVEPLDDLPHLIAEPDDVVAQVRGQRGRVAEEALEVVSRRVVEGELRRLLELRVHVFEAQPPQFGLPCEHLRLGRREHAIESPQHGQREDHVLVLPPLEGVPNQVRDIPDETDDLRVRHLLKPASS